MKNCPMCGKENPDELEFCMYCRGDLALKPPARMAGTGKKAGIHWAWALVIMIAARGLVNAGFNFALSAYLKAQPSAFLYAHELDIYNISFTLELMIHYLFIWAWIRFTSSRYSHSAVWSIFVYLWLTAGPIQLASSWGYSLPVFYSPTFIWFVGIGSMAAAVVLFARHKRKLLRPHGQNVL